MVFDDKKKKKKDWSVDTDIEEVNHWNKSEYNNSMMYEWKKSNFYQIMLCKMRF